MSVGVVALALLASACAQFDVKTLASDTSAGRDNDTPGSTITRQYLLGQLKPITRGANTAATGDAAYLQAIPSGTNVVAVLPGGDLADQYVLVGAHYDHKGSSCTTADPADTICNGATDNAAGVAALLGIARTLASQPTPPRRSVVFALWDREEDGLLGSKYYVTNPLVPLDHTVGYVNFDIQGANLRPSLRSTTFAIAAESGGAALQQIVRDAYGTGPLDGALLSSIFGQGRSDYVNLIGAHVPTVFFSDATGPCYHTAQDDVHVVDFPKLDRQIAVALAVTRALATTATPPPFTTAPKLATYDDAVELAALGDRLSADVGSFSPADQTVLNTARTNTTAIAAAGPAAFDDAAISQLISATASSVSVLTHGPCDGFLTQAP